MTGPGGFNLLENNNVDVAPVNFWLSGNTTLMAYPLRVLNATDPTLPDGSSPVTWGLYEVADSGVLGEFIGHEGEMALYDGINYQFYPKYDGMGFFRLLSDPNGHAGKYIAWDGPATQWAVFQMGTPIPVGQS